ncbi:DUF6452 family protein [Faecalibacter rhinopitheci]|uniref:Uncharacterized protein n=1 Tax=Faecalibacter rhinopitheci TaxID=2779678 RepID=A0A8J7G4E1_9FLAO|nr:DUF6452 family protein [Faecalibacter rhinopitheci]MBF0596462.1 hypothetical protein [Faecalibacter rhinopitheci]MBQ0148950.1 hypothetical protein [Candidatus Onthonaster equi]
MNRNFIKNSVIIALFSALATLTSCEPDDICLAEEAPFITVQMRYSDSTTELEDTIFYEAYINDTLKIGDGNILNKSTFNLPIQTTDKKAIKYILRQGTTYSESIITDGDTIKVVRTAPEDILYVTYDIDNKYNSKACGFGLYFKDTKFDIKTNNWIKDSESVNTTIDNATSTNLIIYSQPRIY